MKSKRTFLDLICLSLISRVFYICLCSFSHYLFEHYDLSTDLCESKSSLKCLLKWDAVHFRDISINGYKQEHSFAFFPLLPYFSRSIFIVLRIVRFPVSLFTVSIILNNLVFLINSVLLYKLTLYYFDFKIANLTFYSFIFNSSSIVYSSMYSESLFMLIFLCSLFYFIKKKEFHCSFLLSLSVLCRSNGLVFCYILFYFKFPLVHLFIFVMPVGLFQLFNLSKILNYDKMNNTELNGIEVVCSPKRFNYLINHKTLTSEFLNTVPPSIIQNFKIFIPYSYLQQKYWDQGFLKFFTLLNIPNMLFSLPFILFSIHGLIYPIKYKRPDKLTTFLYLLLFFNTTLTVFFLHWNTFFRFISYNPLIYWLISYKLKMKKKSLLVRLFIKYYFGFGIVYAILFGAYYPPA